MLFGCGSSDTEGTPAEDLPTTSTPSKDKDGDGGTGSVTPAPEFEASFEEPDGGDPTKDPTPPGGGDQCIDPNDPGGAENLAKKLPDTDDCDNDYKTVEGVAAGGVDVDYYSLSATDEGPSLSHPAGCKLDTDFEDATSGTEICVFARCKNSTADAVTGCETGSQKTSAIGLKGCCAAAPGHAVPKWDCSGFTDDDSADFFISIKQNNNSNKCLPYKFKYRY